MDLTSIALEKTNTFNIQTRGWGWNFSLAEDGLGLGIQRFSLRRLAVYSAEASDAELLPSLRDSITPLLQCTLCPPLLAPRRGSLAQASSGQAQLTTLIWPASNLSWLSR